MNPGPLRGPTITSRRELWNLFLLNIPDHEFSRPDKTDRLNCRIYLILF